MLNLHSSEKSTLDQSSVVQERHDLAQLSNFNRWLRSNIGPRKALLHRKPARFRIARNVGAYTPCCLAANAAFWKGSMISARTICLSVRLDSARFRPRPLMSSTL